MPQQPQQRSRTMKDGVQNQMNDMQNRMGEAGNGVAEVVEQAARRFQEMNMETYRFAQESVGLGINAMNRMVGCRTIGELVEVQRDYLKEAIDQAFDASRRMYGIGSDFADEFGDNFRASLQEATDEAERRRDDIRQVASGKR